ncbi:hypothetical protein [Acidicapsa ligni]|uniref:hypothetical protein n=1 Tax=Acidicapsa ligni TaxID=542300 RepID=UPI0021DF63DE|nr:hypothetical protein [Acidicapsa ligni]
MTNRWMRGVCLASMLVMVSLPVGISQAAVQASVAPVPALTESQKKQAELAADTSQLQVLATELKAEMDKSTKDTLSLSVMRKADEIERLARKIRMEMKVSSAD